MKKTTVLFSLFIGSALFTSGLALNSRELTSSEVEQIHLSCWSTDDASPVERLRLVLNRDLSGLAFLASLNGNPTGEGQIHASTAQTSRLSFLINVVSPGHSFTAQVPSRAFQSQVRSVQLKITQGESATSLDCRKINLRAHEVSSR